MKLEYLFAIFALIGIIDKIIGNKFKLGDEFEKGFKMACPLILSMAGLIVLTPVISKCLVFVFSGIADFFGLDISFVASFFAVDSGGALIAYELADNKLVAAYNGLIVASMFGATICPVVSMALNMIDPKYHKEVLTGFLCGFATIPVGCVIAGLMISLPPVELLKNSAPTLLLSILICVGLIKTPNLVRKILSFVGTTIFTVMLVGLGVGIFDKLTGFKLIPGIAPIDDAISIVGDITIILAGLFPLLAIITKLCNKLFVALGTLLGINLHSVTGLVTTVANCLPMFDFVDKMDYKGRIINFAFVVSSSFVFGDHLAFTLAFDKSFVIPVIVGKLTSGIAAVLLASFIFRKHSI